MSQIILWKIIMLSLFISPAISFLIIETDVSSAIALYLMNIIINIIISIILYTIIGIVIL